MSGEPRLMDDEAPPGVSEADWARYLEVRDQMIDDWRTFFRQAFAALAFNGISGDYAEFGSYGGTTFWLAYEQIAAARVPRHLWAFDSFRGLPRSPLAIDAHPAWMQGQMSTSIDDFHAACERRGIPRSDYTAVEGYYHDTLPPLGAEGAPRDIALAYVDCDMYSSSAAVLEFLRPRLKHGMVVAFDDYFCWTPSHVSGERAALRELQQACPEWGFHRYRDIGWAGTSFVVEHTDTAFRVAEGVG